MLNLTAGFTELFLFSFWDYGFTELELSQKRHMVRNSVLMRKTLSLGQTWPRKSPVCWSERGRLGLPVMLFSPPNETPGWAAANRAIQHKIVTLCCSISQNFLFLGTVAFRFIWQTLSNHGVTRLKRFISQITGNCAVSFYFYLYLMLHAYDQRFDVTENLEKNFELNKAIEAKINWFAQKRRHDQLTKNEYYGRSNQLVYSDDGIVW